MRKHAKWVSKKIAEEKAKSLVGEVRSAYFEYKEKVGSVKAKNTKAMTDEKNKSGKLWNKESEEKLKAEIEKEEVKDYKTSFVSYIKKFAPYFYISRYHLFLVLMCQVAYEKASIRGESVVLAISCPPQTGKTEVVHLFASWLSLKHPDETVLMFSYGYVHAARIGRKMMTVVDKAASEFGLAVAKDRRAINNFGYEGYRGGIESMGIDGTSTGVGGVFKFIDDPLKDDDEASNNSIRDKKWEYIEDKVMTRSNVLPNGGSITFYIMTRRHEDDPIGRLDKMWIPKELSVDGFARKYCEYVRIPFVCDDDRNDPLGRKVGEPLDAYAPKHRGLGIDRANYLQGTISTRRWLAQYQQRPTQEDGNVIKRNMLKFYDTLPPEFEKIVLSCDLSNEGNNKSDFTAFTLWGKLGENHYLIDFAEGKWSFSSQTTIITKYCELYPIDKVLVEKRATGTAMIDYLQQMLKIKSPVVGFEPKFSTKLQRLDSVEPYFTAGQIYIPSEKVKKNVESVFIAQVLAFPNAKNDGLVDTTSQYLIDDKMYKSGRMVRDDTGFYSKLGEFWRR
jgi:predicted phage terminase large subunit-like protein